MQFGVQLATRDGSPPEVMCDIAREAEALGYSSLWIGDHVLLPRDNPFRDGTNPGWRGRYNSNQ
jgi:alkanesulfonate monooxygenase SsuD/methylene tetrahydromethanopterin reductase-like flavin-dependent oxidoreductase (luciferase family)